MIADKLDLTDKGIRLGGYFYSECAITQSMYVNMWLTFGGRKGIKNRVPFHGGHCLPFSLKGWHEYACNLQDC